MNWRPGSCAILLLISVCAVPVLRHDLSQWRLNRADQAFKTGDLRKAQAIWSSATIKPSTRQVALINRGIAHYRLGELTEASNDFRAATTSREHKIKQQALYNLGTTLLMMELKQKIVNRQTSEKLLAEAVRQLQASLDMLPTDADAIQNTNMAKKKLSALTTMQPVKHPDGATAQQSQKENPQASLLTKKTEQTGANAGKPGEATSLDASNSKRRTVPAVSSEQVRRMLDEVRGREALRSGVKARNRQEILAPPEKDW